MPELQARAAAPSLDSKVCSSCGTCSLRQETEKASRKHTAEVFSDWKCSFCYSEQSVHTSRHKLL